MRLLLQPDAGIGPLVKSIRGAKKSIKILIFRLDIDEVERALVDAAKRGVFVHTLIAFTNRGGEKNLRDLEARFLANGITVARTSGDLVRYHGKMMVVDEKELWLLAFNFTHLDVDHSRSFAIVTRSRELVKDADALFEADCKRQDYEPRSSKFIVSPVNARRKLAEFLKGAKKSLLIYDPKVSDTEMLEIIEERVRAGVKVRVIGKTARCSVTRRELHQRLHARTIIRDGADVFMGSQSLKKLELDSRREIGILFHDTNIAKKIAKRFDEDWKKSRKVGAVKPEIPPAKAAKKMAKVVAKRLPVSGVVKRVMKAVKKNGGKKLDPKLLEKTVKLTLKEEVKRTVHEAAKDVVKEMVEEVA